MEELCTNYSSVTLQWVKFFDHTSCWSYVSKRNVNQSTEFVWIQEWFSDTFCLFQHTIDEVENLIKKHEAFEKSAAAQEERFGALERLTTVSTHPLFYVKCMLN